MDSEPVVAVEISKAIIVARQVNVLLDSDLAKLYGVTTMALNQAVKRNASRFPQDFAFQIDPQGNAFAQSNSGFS